MGALDFLLRLVGKPRCQLTCTHPPAKARGLARPKRCKIVEITSFRRGAQWPDARRWQRKLRSPIADRPKLADGAIDDAARRATGEHIRQGCCVIRRFA